MARAQRVEHFSLLAFRVAGRNHGSQQFLQLIARPYTRVCCGCCTLRQSLRRHAGLYGDERRALGGQALLLLQQAALLTLQLLDTGTFDLSLALPGCD